MAALLRVHHPTVMLSLDDLVPAFCFGRSGPSVMASPDLLPANAVRIVVGVGRKLPADDLEAPKITDACAHLNRRVASAKVKPVHRRGYTTWEATQHRASRMQAAAGRYGIALVPHSLAEDLS